MGGIYGPSGRAREYSSLALNLYGNCDHGCTYCYCGTMPGREAWGKQAPKPAAADLDATCNPLIILEDFRVLLGEIECTQTRGTP